VLEKKGTVVPPCSKKRGVDPLFSVDPGEGVLIIEGSPVFPGFLKRRNNNLLCA